jgi:hypothetical protein
VPDRFVSGDLIAYVGPDDPENFMYEGSPGVVCDVTPWDVVIDLDFSLGVCVPASYLAPIDQATFDERAGRMRRELHPLRDERIAPFDPFGDGKGT